MKRFIFFALCVAMTHISANAQSFKWGVKAGISTPDVKPAEAGEITSDSFKFKIADANYGVHFGAFVRFGISKIYIQPELNLNSSKVTYNVQALKKPATAFDTLQKESFLNLDIPILIGFKLGTFRINGGPVGHLHLTNTSDLFQIKTYKSNFNSMKYGYQAGVGLDFGKLGIDIRYEGNFDKFGDHINLGGKPYSFSKNPTRLLVSFGLSF